jgi:ethanolamine utilization protein EutM
MGQALGIVEIRGLAGAIEAANLAVNSAAVDIAATSYALPGVVMVALRGPVDAVAAAIHAVRARLEPSGGLHGWTVLARPDEAVDAMLRDRAVPIGSRAGAPSIPGRGRMHASPEVATSPPKATAVSAPARERRGTAKKSDGEG